MINFVKEQANKKPDTDLFLSELVYVCVGLCVFVCVCVYVCVYVYVCVCVSRLPLQCVWQPAITQTDEDRLIELKLSSFFLILPR